MPSNKDRKVHGLRGPGKLLGKPGSDLIQYLVVSSALYAKIKSYEKPLNQMYCLANVAFISA